MREIPFMELKDEKKGRREKTDERKNRLSTELRR